MSKIIFLLLIIVFLFKTGNVFSENSIFSVDNIIIEKSDDIERELLVNKAIKLGFYKLTQRILKEKDAIELSKTSLKDIKNLVSNYQIINEADNLKEGDVIINLTFDREKINKFFYNKDISYADISKTKLVIFPVLVEKNNINLFSDNYFYNNWENKNIYDFIDYVLPSENLEDIQLINQNKDNLETIKVDKILSKYDIKNYIFLVIKPGDKQANVFLKGKISGNEVIKNVEIEINNNDTKVNYTYIIKEIKKEINELWKSQNLIDISAPAFLNIMLFINESRDLLNLQQALSTIDLIDRYSVLELNKNYAKLNVKYYGKINKIKKKFQENGIIIEIINNEWRVKLN
jgi:hypothetical protein